MRLRPEKKKKKKKVIADEIQLLARRKLAGDFNLGSDVVICSFDWQPCALVACEGKTVMQMETELLITRSMLSEKSI